MILEVDMYDITMFYMATCPYCMEAKRFISFVLEENQKYKDIKINYIDEVEQRELANSYDYYYVPSFYVNGKKIHEGPASLEKVRKVFDAAF